MSRKRSRQSCKNPSTAWRLLWVLALLWGCGESTPADSPDPGGVESSRAEVAGSPGPGPTVEEPSKTGSSPTTPKRRRPHAEGRHGGESSGSSPQQRSEYAQAMIAGETALYSGLFDQARQEYLKALEVRPDKTAPALGALRAVRGRGQAEERSGLVRTIRKKIKQLSSQPETVGAGHLLEARLAIALGLSGDAMDAATLAVELLPDLGVAWRVRGEAAMIAEDWSTAADCFGKAANLGLQAKAGTWERMADALDEMGQLAEAKQAAKRAVELTGNDPNALRRRRNLLALVLKRSGDLDGAREQVEKARALPPADPKVLHNAAAIEEASGKIDEAIALYGKALELAPLPMTYWRRGRLLLLRDKPNRALNHFRKAAAAPEHWTWPASTSFWPAFDTAKLYARAKRFDEALGWFEDAARLAILPRDHKDIRSWIRFTHAERRRATKDASPASPSPPE